MRNILITGVTGFLGSYILKELLEDENICPIVLVRSKRGLSAKERLDNVFKYFYGENGYKMIAARVKMIEGEVNSKSLGIDEKQRRALVSEIDEIYHSAAIAEFRFPLEEIRKINVEGVRNILDFALECKKSGRLNKVNHVSTTYTAGTKKVTYYEKDLDLKQEFNNSYEQSKFEAELLVREYRKNGLDVTVFRPSMLTGDYVLGKTSSFKMLYQPLHFLAAELFEVIPAHPAAQENIIPVDSAAKAICILANKKDSANATYHISSGSVVEFGHFVDVAADFFGFKKPKLVPLAGFNKKMLSFVQEKLLEPYIPYFNYEARFDSSCARDLLVKSEFKYPYINDDYLKKIFTYCLDIGFIKRKRSYIAAR